jgi:hypothetical protein
MVFMVLYFLMGEKEFPPFFSQIQKFSTVYEGSKRFLSFFLSLNFQFLKEDTSRNTALGNFSRQRGRGILGGNLEMN